MRGRGWLAAVIGGIVVGVLGGARGRVTRYEIAQDSMLPTLRAGDYVIAVRSGPVVRRGDVVILPSPEDPAIEMVKRVAGGPGDQVELPAGTVRLGPDELFVLGDNPNADAVDSRRLGPVPVQSVGWRVRYRYWPPSRIGRVR